MRKNTAFIASLPEFTKSVSKVTRILWLMLVVLASALTAYAQPITLVTLGDSLTEGAGDDGIGGGYPARLLTLLEPGHPGSTLSNQGISGDTSDDLVIQRLALAIDDLNAAPSGNLKVALLWIGSNDLFGIYSWVCDNFNPPNDYPACEGEVFTNYHNNLTTALDALEATGAEVLIALLDDQSRRPVMADPVLRADAYPEIDDTDVARMSDQVLVYNAEIAAQAASRGEITVDFFNTTIFENELTLSEDGNHPNGEGYDAIAAIWFLAINGAPSDLIFANGFETGSTAGWSDVVF